MTDAHSEVDEYLDGLTKWEETSRELRRIALDCGLRETLKWNKPCYCHDGGNIAIIQGFKDNCSLMFFKGALLDDPDGLLVEPGPNSRIARRVEFTHPDQVRQTESTLRAFIEQAIHAEEEGLEVEVDDESEPIPEEFQEKLDANPDLRAAFDELTPGRQRAYLLYFSGAKRSETRTARVERYEQKILEGKGMRD